MSNINCQLKALKMYYYFDSIYKNIADIRK